MAGGEVACIQGKSLGVDPVMVASHGDWQRVRTPESHSASRNFCRQSYDHRLLRGWRRPGRQAALSKGNQQIITELQADSFLEKDNGTLESYLFKIRRDGVAKNSQMKQRFDGMFP